MSRRLAAILAADVVGYSRLMEADEVGTLAALRSHREDLIDPLISEYDGRLVKLMGDGALVEFGSVVDAVACARAIQDGMVRRNDDVAEDRRIAFRIGIHLGDVIVEGDDLYGDGVNIAARLEGLAEPGGICISRQAYDQVENKLNLSCRDLGSQHVKNIARSVHAYRVAPGTAARVAPVPHRSRRTMRVAALAVLAIAVLGTAAVWWQPWRSEMAVPETALPTSDRPSIAVLPFVNISDDAEQEYFSDGMTEDLITDLSKISSLAVFPRTETEAYKGRAVDVREVGKALDVRYVIAGSVRKAGEQVRINAQLIDTGTGVQLWGERYDAALDEIFSLQDRVLEKIVGALALRLSEQERQRLAFHGTDSVAAHDLYLRGLYQESAFTRDGNREAMRLYEQALSIDPDYPLPYTRMANILELSARNGWSNDIRADLNRAVELAEKAIVLDPQNPRTHWSLGRAVARLGSPQTLSQGTKAMQRAIELDPDFADAYAFLAVLYIADGRAEDGLRSVESAIRLNPRYPFWYLFVRGMTRYVVEDYESAIADFEAAAERSPTAQFVRWWLAAAYAQTGRTEDAQWQVDELYMMGFDGTIATIMDTQPIQDPAYLAVYREGLRKAGIPE